MVAAAEWKVATFSSDAHGPSNAASRSRISRAALLVKVTARIRQGATRRARTRWATLRVMTRVFPEPAPARTRSGPTPWSTASRWGGFRSSRSWSADWSGDGPDIGAGHPLIPGPGIPDVDRADQWAPPASSTFTVTHGATAKQSAITAYPSAQGQAGVRESTVSAGVQR